MMKKTVLILLILLSVPSYGFCFDREEVYLDLQPKLMYDLKTDLQEGIGIEGRLGYKYLFMWGSYESYQRQMYGQSAGDFDIYGFGLGLKIPIHKHFSVYSKVGWYEPKSEMEDNPKKYSEMLYYKFLELEPHWGWGHFSDKYDYEISGGIGGSIGISFEKEIYQSKYGTVEFGFNLEGRMIKFKEKFKQYEPREPWSREPDQVALKHYEDWNLNSISFGMQLTYRF